MNSAKMADPFRKIESFQTSKGSIYTSMAKRLAGQRWRRYKTVTGKLEEPMDSTLFIPSLDEMIKRDPKIGNYFKTEKDWASFLEGFVYAEGRSNYIRDQKGRNLINNHHIYETLLGGGNVSFVSKNMFNGKEDLRIRGSLEPVIGSYPIEISKTGDGKIVHLGHAVTKINYV